MNENNENSQKEQIMRKFSNFVMNKVENALQKLYTDETWRVSGLCITISLGFVPTQGDLAIIAKCLAEFGWQPAGKAIIPQIETDEGAKVPTGEVVLQITPLIEAEE